MGELGVNFWLFRCSQMVIRMGYYASSFALMWWVLDAYHSASYVTYILASSIFLGTVLRVILSPLGDLFNKKGIVLTGTAIQLLAYSIICVLLFFSKLTVINIACIELASAVGASFVEVGSVGMLPMLVSKNKILNATKTIASLDSMVMLVGAPFGGFLLTLSGVLFSFVFYSVMLLFSTVLVCCMKLNKAKKDTNKQDGVKHNFLKELQFGIRFTWGNRITRTIFIFSLLIGMAFSCLQITIPYLINVVNKLPAEYLGFMVSSMGGGGVIFGSLIIGFVMRFMKNKVIVYLSVGLFVIASVLLSATLNPWVYIIAYFIFGVSRNFINIIVDTNLLIFLPAKDRTKVMSNVVFCSNLAMPLMLILSGKMIDAVGPSLLLYFVVVLFLLSFLSIVSASEVGMFLDADSSSRDNFFDDKTERV